MANPNTLSYDEIVQALRQENADLRYQLLLANLALQKHNQEDDPNRLEAEADND